MDRMQADWTLVDRMQADGMCANGMCTIYRAVGESGRNRTGGNKDGRHENIVTEKRGD